MVQFFCTHCIQGEYKTDAFHIQIGRKRTLLELDNSHVHSQPDVVTIVRKKSLCKFLQFY